MLPRALTVEHVRAVTDRVFTERGRILKRILGERDESRVAEAQREIRLGLLELHGESVVINDLQSGKRAVRVIAEALDGLEEVAVELLVAEQCTILPGVHE